jgi:separase
LYSPALVANLWDVTDKDIDRFGKSLLEKWGICTGTEDESSNNRLGNRDVSLSEAVAMSRDSCKLKFLVGAAPVVFGIPVFCSRPSS